MRRDPRPLRAAWRELAAHERLELLDVALIAAHRNAGDDDRPEHALELAALWLGFSADDAARVRRMTTRAKNAAGHTAPLQIVLDWALGELET